MAYTFKNYTVRRTRIENSDYRGFVLKENGCLLEELLLSRKRSPEEKEKYFSGTDSGGSKKFIGCEDVLLYGIKGRYLWLCIELIGTGTGIISSINVDSPGDIMLDVFPEIYQEKGSFLHGFRNGRFRSAEDVRRVDGSESVRQFSR